MTQHALSMAQSVHLAELAFDARFGSGTFQKIKDRSSTPYMDLLNMWESDLAKNTEAKAAERDSRQPQSKLEVFQSIENPHERGVYYAENEDALLAELAASRRKQ